MKLETTTPVGQIAADVPLATRVFARHGIDFCCGGGKPIEEVCERKGLDASTILREIEAEVTSAPNDVTRWTEAPLDDLVDHIVETFHRPLEEELPRLEFMARKVNRVHGDKSPEVLPALVDTFIRLKAELEDHMGKEEDILFPAIKAGKGATAAGPMAVMEDEHLAAGEALARIRDLTENFQVPEDACNTWRALWHGLEALEQTMHIHIHLENNILFPRALAS